MLFSFVLIIHFWSDDVKLGEFVCMCIEGPTNALFPQDIIFFCRPRRSCPYETPLFSRGGFYCVALPRGSCAGAQGKHCDQSPELAETTESCGVFSLYLIFPLLDDPELLDFRSFACTSALCMYYFFI